MPKTAGDTQKPISIHDFREFSSYCAFFLTHDDMTHPSIKDNINAFICHSKWRSSSQCRCLGQKKMDLEWPLSWIFDHQNRVTGENECHCKLWEVSFVWLKASYTTAEPADPPTLRVDLFHTGSVGLVNMKASKAMGLVKTPFVP